MSTTFPEKNPDGADFSSASVGEFGDQSGYLCASSLFENDVAREVGLAIAKMRTKLTQWSEEHEATPFITARLYEAEKKLQKKKENFFWDDRSFELIEMVLDAYSTEKAFSESGADIFDRELFSPLSVNSFKPNEDGGLEIREEDLDSNDFLQGPAARHIVAVALSAFVGSGDTDEADYEAMQASMIDGYVSESETALRGVWCVVRRSSIEHAMNAIVNSVSSSGAVLASERYVLIHQHALNRLR